MSLFSLLLLFSDFSFLCSIFSISELGTSVSVSFEWHADAHACRMEPRYYSVYVCRNFFNSEIVSYAWT